MDPAAIVREREKWIPLSREDAVRFCAFRHVAVVYRVAGVPAAAWLSLDSPFYRAHHPVLYEQLRYYAYAASQWGLLKPLRVDRPLGEEAEPLEALDEAGEPLNLGSPIPGAADKPKPKLPVGSPENIFPGKAGGGLIPDPAHALADAGKGPGFSAPGLDLEAAGLDLIPKGLGSLADARHDAVPGPGLPTLDVGAEAADMLPDKPVLPSIPLPIEILLLDENGVPLGDRAFTARFPDGKEETGRSDGSGFIRFPENTQSGDLLLTLIDPEPRGAA